MRARFIPLILLLAAAVCGAAYLFSARGGDQSLSVVFFDVGQGDSCLIRTPAGSNILVDGGPDNKVLRRLPRHLGFFDRTIDLMILTHPHDDHVFGLIEVAKRYDVRRIFYNGIRSGPPIYEAWLETVSRSGIPAEPVDRPRRIVLGDNCALDFIYPETASSGREKNLNDTSLVFRLDCAGGSFLFTGDIEAGAEASILAGGRRLKADVLKVAHHGSDTGTTRSFLEAVQPELAVISVGEINDFGHPGPRILSRPEGAAVKTFRTDRDETIMIRVEAGKITAAAGAD